MPLFSYQGLNAAGKKTTGQIDAANERAAVGSLREQSIFVLKMVEGDVLPGAGNILSKLRKGISMLNPLQFLPVQTADLVALFQHLALMLRSGYTLVPALQAAAGMQTKLSMIRPIERICDSIRAGASFSVSIGKEKRLFPAMVVNLVGIGEQSGNLDSILDRLSENMEQSKDLKRQLLGAMLYPSVVLLSSVGLIVYMVVKVIPSFSAFLTSRGSSLPGSTQFLLDVSDWTLEWGKLLSIVLGSTTFLILAAYTTRRGKRVLDQMILAIPLVGTAIQFSAMAQAGWCLSLCLRSGIPALTSLRINSEALGNLAIGASFERAADELLLGKALSKAIEQPHIPAMMRHMTAVGEASGELDTVLHNVGLFYQRELAAKVKFMSIMIEPVMIILVGGLVGFVYFSIFEAVMSVSKGGM